MQRLSELYPQVYRARRAGRTTITLDEFLVLIPEGARDRYRSLVFTEKAAGLLEGSIMGRISTLECKPIQLLLVCELIRLAKAGASVATMSARTAEGSSLNIILKGCALHTAETVRSRLSEYAKEKHILPTDSKKQRFTVISMYINHVNTALKFAKNVLGADHAIITDLLPAPIEDGERFMKKIGYKKTGPWLTIKSSSIQSKKIELTLWLDCTPKPRLQLRTDFTSYSESRMMCYQSSAVRVLACSLVKLCLFGRKAVRSWATAVLERRSRLTNSS